jgi:hypothetical protein
MISFEDFCALPPAEISKLVPRSMIYAAGGTRRAAALAGIQDQDEYVAWSAEQLLIGFGLFAKYGVRHILTHAIVPTQWQEDTPGYREKLIGWITGTLLDEKTINAYRTRNWRQTMLGIDTIPAFKPVQEKLNKIFSRRTRLRFDGLLQCYTNL